MLFTAKQGSYSLLNRAAMIFTAKQGSHDIHCLKQNTEFRGPGKKTDAD
jgi:hypothetical protein